METNRGTAVVAGANERIFIAQTLIEPGTPFTHENLRLAAWDKHTIPEDAIRQLDDLLGKVAKVAVPAGDAVQRTNVLTVDEYAAMLRAERRVASKSSRKSDSKSNGKTDESRPSDDEVASEPRATVREPMNEATPTVVEKPAKEEVAVTPPATPAATESVSPPVTPSAPATSQAETHPVATEEPAPPRSVATPRTIAERRPSERPVTKVTEARADDGWVRTYSRTSGSKVLRWRPDSDTPATESADKSSGGQSPSGVERTARPSVEPRKG